MNETPDEHNAKPTFAVKYEESLELLKAFLMMKDPRLRRNNFDCQKDVRPAEKARLFFPQAPNNPFTKAIRALRSRPQR
jgi:hypothetical protein